MQGVGGHSATILDIDLCSTIITIVLYGIVHFMRHAVCHLGVQLFLLMEPVFNNQVSQRDWFNTRDECPGWR